MFLALKDFFKENGFDKSSVLAYYSIFSSLFLLTFFTFLFTRFLGDPDIALKSIYPFSADFFSKISPDVFTKAEEISSKLKSIGIVGVSFSFFLGFLVSWLFRFYIVQRFPPFRRYNIGFGCRAGCSSIGILFHRRGSVRSSEYRRPKGKTFPPQCFPRQWNAGAEAPSGWSGPRRFP